MRVYAFCVYVRVTLRFNFAWVETHGVSPTQIKTQRNAHVNAEGLDPRLQCSVSGAIRTCTCMCVDAAAAYIAPCESSTIIHAIMNLEVGMVIEECAGDTIT